MQAPGRAAIDNISMQLTKYCQQHTFILPRKLNDLLFLNDLFSNSFPLEDA